MTTVWLLWSVCFCGLRVLASAAPRINGWYPCGFSTVDSGDDSNEGDVVASVAADCFECAQVEVPLCYADICESSKTIDVFVKRKAANTTAQDGVKQALWLLQGGPGASSEAMEIDMHNYYERLNGSLSVYTMDHRGTGRSFFLKCEAAQAFTGGSPGGFDLNYSEYPACLQDILFQIDNQTSAFSVTSTAKDLEYLIENLNTEEEAYVYGASYGTYLTFRAMHLAPKQVKGYIVDGIVSEAGPDEDTRMTYSYWDYDIIPTTYRFFEYCRNDSACPLVFKGKAKALDQVRANLSRWDNECSQQIETNYRSLAGTAEEVLRYFFYETVSDMKNRELIPAVLERAFRCNQDDQRELKLILDETLDDLLHPDAPKLVDVIEDSSDILYNLIVFSEQWSIPSPTQETLNKLQEESLFMPPGSVNLYLYCMFTGRKNEQACKDVYYPDCPTFVYPTDQYFNKTAPIPDGSSVLMFSGKLDFQTASEYGLYQYHQLRGDKMLVEFDYGGHCAGLGNTPDEDAGVNCGVEIGASFIRNHGEVSQVDTSCMNDITPMDLSEHRIIKMLSEIQEEQEEENDQEETDRPDDEWAIGFAPLHQSKRHHRPGKLHDHLDKHQQRQQWMPKLHQAKRLMSLFEPRRQQLRGF